MTEPPCRVSADLRAYQLREDRRERAALVECSRCGRTVHESDLKDWDWIECKRHECHNVLCVDCQGELDKDESWYGCLEAVYEDEYCSPWCVVLALRAANERLKRLTEATRSQTNSARRSWRRPRSRKHEHSESEIQGNRRR